MKHSTVLCEGWPNLSALEPVLFVPDVHRPYHDKRAWRLFMQAARFLKPKHLVIIGDFADFYTVSAHSKDPRRALKLDVELADVRHGLDELDALKPSGRKIYIEGNHCDRWRRYLQDKAPELFGALTVPELFSLDKRGWEFVPYKQYTKLGAVHLTHDCGSSGRYSVFRCLDTFQHSVVTGHSHRLAYIVEGDATGEPRVSAQFGHLVDVEATDYMHSHRANKDWGRGFGVGYHDPSTAYVYLTPVPIVNYTCAINGKLFSEPAKRGETIQSTEAA